jgi:phosphoribosylanthranilate isomerase
MLTKSGVTQVCVIYNPVNGKIVHIHSETFAEGMQLHSDDKMEELARQRAREAKRELTDVKVIHLRDPRFVGWPTRVDPTTGELEMADVHSFRKPSG